MSDGQTGAGSHGALDSERRVEPPRVRASPEVFCMQCGARFVDRASRAPQELPTCWACGDVAIDVRPLLIELHLSELTYRACPRCNAANDFRPYCYRCGSEVESSP